MQGGYYVSDLFDGTYTVGGAYTYHMTEDLAVEASGSYTRITSSGGPELERTFAVLRDKPRRQLGFDADLVWVPAHAQDAPRRRRSRTSISTSRPAAASSTPCCRATSPATAAWA